MRLHEEAILAGDAVAFDDLGARARDLGHALQLPRRGADAHDRAEAVAERAGVDFRAVARDAALVLQALEALGDRRRGQADAPAELREAEPGIVLQFGEEPEIGGIERATIGRTPDFPVVSKPCRRVYR